MSVDPIHLVDVPFLALLDDEQRALLATRLDTVSEPAGKSMFMYGDPGDSAYIIRSGVVEIYSKNDTGERLVLETARAGDFFGEISLLDGGPRTASVIAETPVVAIRLFKASFDKVVREEPRVAGKILAAVARRLREAEKTVTA